VVNIRKKMLGARAPGKDLQGRVTYLDMHELRRKKITPPSSPGLGMARHHWPPG